MPSFSKAIEHGRPITVDGKSTLADGLAVPKVGCNAFATAANLVDKMVTHNNLLPIIFKSVNFMRSISFHFERNLDRNHLLFLPTIRVDIFCPYDWTRCPTTRTIFFFLKKLSFKLDFYFIVFSRENSEKINDV